MTKVEDFAIGSKACVYPNVTILKCIWKHNCEVVDGEQGGSWYISFFHTIIDWNWLTKRPLTFTLAFILR